jgi:pimeloyl-ACP methyl ester carboxylesterase
MAVLKREDAEIFYTSFGEEGEWVTLLNGYMRSSRDFSFLAKGLVQAGFRVLTLDNRGTGNTVSHGAFMVEDMVGDVFALWEALKVEKSHIVGFSMGGFLSQYAAWKKPTCIQSLSLVSTCLRPSQIIRESRFWSRDVAENFLILQSYVGAKFRKGNALVLQGMAQKIAEAVEQGAFLPNAHHQLTALKSYHPPEISELCALKMPVLILHGVEDQVAPLERGQELAQVFPKSQLVVVPEVGHLLLAECGPLLLSELCEFLGVHVGRV